MHRFFASIQLLLLAGFLALGQQGCAFKEEVVQQPSADSYPNAFAIEQQVDAQTGRINQNLDTGMLEPDMARGLLATDGMVQGLSRRYRSRNPSGDLDPSQTTFLSVLLRGNESALNDALENRQDWVYAFNGDLDYDFYYRSDRLLYIIVLQSRLERQQSDLNAAFQSGNLSPDQAQQGRQRLQSVRDVEVGDFQQNNAMDLSSDQILELRQMSDDSGRFIKFLAQGINNGPMPNGVPPSGGNNSMEAFASIQGSNTGNNTSTTNNIHFPGGRPNILQTKAPAPTPVQAQAAPTPVPTTPARPFFTARPQFAAPTATPVPYQPAVPTSTPLAQTHQPPFSQPGNGATGPGNQSHQPMPFHTGNGPGAVAPQTGAAYQSADALKARGRKLDMLLDMSRKLGRGNTDAYAAATQKQNNFNNALKSFLAQNNQKGLTQDQYNQLSKMLDDYTKSVSAFGPGQPKP